MASRYCRRAHGFSLIEVLITLLVFSIGVLSVAGLQAISKKNNYDALQRTTAANLGHTIIANMRANPAALSDYYVTTASPLGHAREITEPEPNCFSTDCSPSELAAFDLWQWDLALDGAQETATQGNTVTRTGGLAFPSACISGPTGGGAGFYQIIIVWRGVSQTDEQAVNDCGADLGLYGAPDADNDNSYQRAFVLNTYITP